MINNKNKKGFRRQTPKPPFRFFKPCPSLPDQFHYKTNRRNNEHDPYCSKYPFVQKDFCMLRHFITSALPMRDVAWDLPCSCFYRGAFRSNSGKHMGSYQRPPRRNGLTPFLFLSVFFMSEPRFKIYLFLTVHAWVYRRGSSSGRSSTSCRSSRSWLFPSWRCLLGFPDPGTVISFASCCLTDPGRHGVVPSDHCSLSLNSI